MKIYCQECCNKCMLPGDLKFILNLNKGASGRPLAPLFGFKTNPDQLPGDLRFILNPNKGAGGRPMASLFGFI